MVGRKLSEEHKEKISNSLKGIKRSEETRKKMTEAQKKRKYTGWNNYKKGIPLSEEHKKKLSESNNERKAWNKGKKYKMPQIAGEKNARWRGYRIKRKDGYVLVKSDENSVYSTRTLEHRIIMEKHLGRRLKGKEIIHHKNEIKDDNKPENLQLTTRKYHSEIHHLERDSEGRFIKIGKE